MGNSRHSIGWIPKSDGGFTPVNILVFDTETYVERDNSGNVTFPFRVGVANDITYLTNIDQPVIKQSVFRSASEFVKLVKRLCYGQKDLYIYGHNVGFDIRVLNLPRIFNEAGITSTPPIINDRIFIWKCVYLKTHIIFVDTANYAVNSVAQLGELYAFPKLTIDFDKCTDDELITYCARDVDITTKFVLEYIRFINHHRLGSVKNTLASQALEAWRYRLMLQSVQCHNDSEILSIERQGYKGGRVECFRLGTLPEQPFYDLDVNSMYPTVMRYSKLPYAKIGIEKDVKPSYLWARCKQQYCIADVTLQTDRNLFAQKVDGKLMFRTGKFRTVLHNSELLEALEHDEIVTVHSCVNYEAKVIFKEYVNFFYDVKLKAELENNPVWRFIAKIFLNSLYGKFGQEGIVTSMLGKEDNELIWRVPFFHANSGDKGQEICWFGNIFREVHRGEGYFSFPALAGAVTAEARLLLYSYMRDAGLSEVMYCDTDSLIVTETGYNRLSKYIHPTLLGKLKLVDMSYYVTIHGCKDYEFGGTLKSKGIPSKALPLAENKWQYLQFQGFNSWLNSGGDGPPIGTEIIKQRKSTYDKGEVNRETGQVIPFCLVG